MLQLSRQWRVLSAQRLAEATTSLYRSLAVAAPEETDAAEPDSARDADTIRATPREASGTTASERLRKTGKTPAILFSLPGNQSQLLALDSKEITRLVKRVGRLPFQCRVFDLEVQGQDGAETQKYRVVPRLLHVNAVTNDVENVTLMHMPPDRRAAFHIPVQVTGKDMCPGVKRGGWVNLVHRTVQVSCRGDAIPPHIEVDVSQMDTNQKLRLEDLAGLLPQGATLLAHDLKQPVIRIAK